MAKVWLVLGLSSALRATQEGGEEISSAVRYAEEDVDCSSLKFVSSEPYDVSHIRKILTHYWETSIGFYDCEECDKNRWNCYWKYYTYFKKHNRFAVLQAHIDSKAKNDAMCATEGWQHWGEDWGWLALDLEPQVLQSQFQVQQCPSRENGQGRTWALQGDALRAGKERWVEKTHGSSPRKRPQICWSCFC